MKKIFSSCLMAVTACALLLGSCREKNAGKNKLPVPEVTVIAAKDSSLAVYTEFVGQTSGDANIDIYSRAQGLVTGKYFTEGDLVRQGTLLYTIDDLSIRAEIGGYKAQLAKANTLLTNKKSTLLRVQPLAEMKALSQQDLEAAVADYKSAESEVEIAASQLADMEVTLGYTKITAPITGIIGISRLDVGGYASTTSTSPLNTISSIDTMDVLFSIPESDYLWVMKRNEKDPTYRRQLDSMQVQMILADGSVYAETGQLSLINRQVDPATGSMQVQASFPNKKQLLRPGQYVKIRLKIDQLDNAVLVPQQAVNQLQNIFQVLVLNDSNKLVPRMVVPGLRIGSNWVIKQGLKVDEKVALMGNAFINLQLPVRPVITK